MQMFLALRIRLFSSRALKDGPSLKDFLRRPPSAPVGSASPSGTAGPNDPAPRFAGDEAEDLAPVPKKVFVETYGCQMNTADTETVLAIMAGAGYVPTERMDDADAIFINTCSVRDNAEQRVRGRLGDFKAEKRRRGRANPPIVGVLGCMAERLKKEILETHQFVDVVVGPDAYRDLPRLMKQVEDTGQSAINVQLSMDETYADVAPVRTGAGGLSAFVSISRGCNHM